MGETIFYDGHCGLCHRLVRFVLPRDCRRWFSFAPIGGVTFTSTIDADKAAALPDSVIVRTEDGRLLTRSDASLHILARLGSGWRSVAALARLVPRPLRDWAYDAIARLRGRLFRPPEDACPVVPPELRDRLLP